MIYVPSSAAESDYGKQRYPVFYSLDGDENYFTMWAGTVRFLSTIYDPVFPESIVVSIPGRDRTRNLTPTHHIYSPDDSTSGGGEKFISFIEKELIPYINNNYPTTAYKILSGGSIAGLLGGCKYLCIILIYSILISAPNLACGGIIRPY